MLRSVSLPIFLSVFSGFFFFVFFVVDGRVLADLKNMSFVDERIYIGHAVRNNSRVFNSTDVMKYVKTATNCEFFE